MFFSPAMVLTQFVLPRIPWISGGKNMNFVNKYSGKRYSQCPTNGSNPTLLFRVREAGNLGVPRRACLT